MSELQVIRDGRTEIFSFQAPAGLKEVLEAARILLPHPCGGRGSCGKCTVVLSGEVSPPNPAEQRFGARLSCQAVLLGDAKVLLPDRETGMRIETGGVSEVGLLRPMAGATGAAVDIGTTTLAVRVYDLKTGTVLGEASGRNPQDSVAADVMGRIEAAGKGGLASLQEQVLHAIRALLTQAGTPEPDSLVLTGNTTMLYLLTGRDPECLSHAPFRADTLFGVETEVLRKPAYLPVCMDAFVGADITCAVLASGMCSREETALLCDIGTNGEIALWNDGKLYVTSTAAGPAFEGAGISCGCGSVPGAIDQVQTANGRLVVHTIGEQKACGVCGSGLIDAVAAGLQLELIDGTGLLEDDPFCLSGAVALTQKDLRAVQLAKAAIAAGIAVLLETARVPLQDVQKLYIAGGFGSHLNVGSACAIGMLPEALAGRTVILGNAALSGAVRTLLNTGEREALERIAAASVSVNLGGNPRFNQQYVEEMFFPGYEE